MAGTEMNKRQRKKLRKKQTQRTLEWGARELTKLIGEAIARALVAPPGA
jgi:hypothetical protein